MWVLVLIMIYGQGVATSSNGTAEYGKYKTLEQCESAGRDAQNNVVSSLEGNTPLIGFTCYPDRFAPVRVVPSEE